MAKTGVLSFARGCLTDCKTGVAGAFKINFEADVFVGLRKIYSFTLHFELIKSANRVITHHGGKTMRTNPVKIKS